MSTIKCFMIEPTERVRRWLRRYVSGSECLAGGIHQAMVAIEEGKAVGAPRGFYTTEPSDWPHDDPRWPKACQCGYVFREEDTWQLFYYRIYVRQETGEECTLHDPPVGAMWYADWMLPDWKGPDGRCLMVRTPGGDWCVDGPSRSGGGWTRTGEPPNVTARPSIGKLDDKGNWQYHGFLTEGYLVEV